MFEVVVGAGDFGELVALVDPDLQDFLGDEAEDGVGGLLQILAGGDVGGERRAGEVERALLLQEPRRDGRRFSCAPKETK